MNDPSKWTELMKTQQKHNQMVEAFTCCNPEDRLKLMFRMFLIINERLDHIEQQTKPSQKP